MNDTDAAAAAAAFRARNVLVLRWKDGAMDGKMDGRRRVREAAHTDAFSRKRHVFHHGTRARRTRWMRDDEGLITRRGFVKDD